MYSRILIPTSKSSLTVVGGEGIINTSSAVWRKSYHGVVKYIVGGGCSFGKKNILSSSSSSLLQSFSVIGNYNNNSVNRLHLTNVYSNYNNQRKYSSDNQQQNNNDGKTQDDSKEQLEWRLAGKDRGLDNLLVFLLGSAISLISLTSVSFYFLEDRNQLKVDYISNILNYFWWAPPIGLWQNNGELVEFIELLRQDKLSNRGVQLLYNISTYKHGREYLIKKGVFEILLERVSNIQNWDLSQDRLYNQQYLKNLELQLSLLLQLSLYSGIEVPEEPTKHIKELKKRFADLKLQTPFDSDFFIEQSQLLSHMTRLYESPVGLPSVLLYGIGSGLYAYLRLKRRQLPWQTITSGVRNTVIASSLVAGIHTYRNYTNNSVIGKSTSYNQFIGNVEICSIFYSTALLAVSGLSNLYWIVPTTALYIMVNTYQVMQLYKSVAKDVEKSLRRQEITWKAEQEHNINQYNHNHHHTNNNNNNNNSQK